MIKMYSLNDYFRLPMDNIIHAKMHFNPLLLNNYSLECQQSFSFSSKFIFWQVTALLKILPIFFYCFQDNLNFKALLNPAYSHLLHASFTLRSCSFPERLPPSTASLQIQTLHLIYTSFFLPHILPLTLQWCFYFCTPSRQ